MKAKELNIRIKNCKEIIKRNSRNYCRNEELDLFTKELKKLLKIKNTLKNG